MASHTPRSFPRRRESSSDDKTKSWVPAGVYPRPDRGRGTSGSKSAPTENRRRGRELARPSRQRAALFAEDARSLSARRRAVPRISHRTSRRRAVPERPRGAQAGRRARVFGGAARGRDRQPLADAHACRRSRLRPLSRTQRQGQGRRARRGADAQDRQDLAAAAIRHCGAARWRRRASGRRRHRAMGAGARRRGVGAALWQRLAHLRGARFEARRFRRPADAMPLR